MGLVVGGMVVVPRNNSSTSSQVNVDGVIVATGYGSVVLELLATKVVTNSGVVVGGTTVKVPLVPLSHAVTDPMVVVVLGGTVVIVVVVVVGTVVVVVVVVVVTVGVVG